jgi:hypothetical protein
MQETSEHSSHRNKEDYEADTLSYLMELQQAGAWKLGGAGEDYNWEKLAR